jgi:hypothetical protein
MLQVNLGHDRREPLRTWLPDGIFPYRKSQFGQFLEGLGMEHVGIIYKHLVYFMANLYFFWKIGKFWGHLVNFGKLDGEKSGNPVYVVQWKKWSARSSDDPTMGD